MPKLFAPTYGNADPMGPEPKNAGETAPMYGTMFKFQYDRGNSLTPVVASYTDTTERDADPRVQRDGALVTIGNALWVRVAGVWKTVAVA